MSAATKSGVAPAPLEDLMVAMDVVDTVRHRHLLVDRELDADARRQRLLARLRDIYSAQGIDVTDAALEAGVAALEEERFKYSPSSKGFSNFLARLYINRGKWLRPFAFLVGLLLIAWLVWYFAVGLPTARTKALLPEQIEKDFAAIVTQATGDTALSQARELHNQANRALNAEDYETARRIGSDLQGLLRNVESSYEIRIVSRPNELSGVWRVPNVNSTARNYYLIVEAVSPAGNVLSVPIRSEEDGKIRTVSSWGVRVSQDVFDQVGQDKRDDGIIQADVIGTKPVGRIVPEYAVPTTGAAITDW